MNELQTAYLLFEQYFSWKSTTTTQLFICRVKAYTVGGYVVHYYGECFSKFVHFYFFLGKLLLIPIFESNSSVPVNSNEKRISILYMS